MPLKDPRITVTASADLLAQLLNADTALKASRVAPEKKAAGELHALIVQISSARARVPVVGGQFMPAPTGESPE